MQYVYLAKIIPDGEYFFIEFSDLPNVVTQGDDLHHAVEMSEDVLNLALVTMEDDGETIPEATAAYSI